jgi:hypothetical protein
MEKIDLLLSEANSRLKLSNSGIRILQRGNKLSLRGILPAKIKGKPSQQVVSLGIYFNAAGIQSAERKAQKLASELALNQFAWENWTNKSSVYGSCGYWLKEFETDYFNRKSRTEQTETTWDTDYNHIFKRLDPSKNFTEDILIELVFTTLPDTRQRKRAVMVASALAKFAKLDVDLKRYSGNYSHLTQGDRILPSELEIVNFYHSIPNKHWQRVFGLMAAYGVSNHELFYCELDSLQKPPGHLVSTYRKLHYGVRRIYCLYPEWYEEWKLDEPIELPKISGKNNRDLGHRVSNAFRRYKVCKPGDLRHCWAIRAMNFIPDAMAARMMAHTVDEHNKTYKRWIDEKVEDRFYKLLIDRSDRPKPPKI